MRSKRCRKTVGSFGKNTCLKITIFTQEEFASRFTLISDTSIRILPSFGSLESWTLEVERSMFIRAPDYTPPATPCPAKLSLYDMCMYSRLASPVCHPESRQWTGSRRMAGPVEGSSPPTRRLHTQHRRS